MSTEAMNVMLLAAGEGTRLRPYTLEKPKPCIPFLSVPLAFYSLSLLSEINVHNLVTNVFHLPDQVQNLFFKIPKQWKNLSFSHEKDGLLDSGGGIHKALPQLIGKKNFWVMNADEIILPNLTYLMRDMLRFHQHHNGIATLMTMDHPQVGLKFGGAWLKDKDANGCGVIDMFSKKLPGPEWQGKHFVGVMLLSDRIEKYFKPRTDHEVPKENILYDTLTTAMQNKEQVFAYHADVQWFETGNPTDFLSASQFCLNQLQQNNSEYWKEFLLQTIRLYSTRERLLESENDMAELKKILIQSSR
jgi:mannose-1-phosphate guanylyltransferase